MQTIHTNMPSTMSNTHGHRRIGSGELDVFEAARYFSGDIDGLALGFGAERKNRSCLEIPTQAMPLHVPPNLNQKQVHKLEKRSCKPLNSPTAKLANYLNSFLLQRSSKKKSKSNSNSKCITTKTRINTSQSLKSDHHHESMTIRSYSDCSKSYYYSSSGFGTPTQAVERTISADGFFGSRSQYHTCSIHKDWFSENKNINNQYRIIKGRKSCYKKDAGEEGEDDGESDSSSDLFELRNMDAIADDGPSQLPVYGTTSFEVLKREAAIAS